MREFSQVTVGFIKKVRGEIEAGGNTRKIVVPSGLQKELLAYCARNGIRQGPIFVAQRGGELHRVVVNAAMKPVSYTHLDVYKRQEKTFCFTGTDTGNQENLSNTFLHL